MSFFHIDINPAGYFKAVPSMIGATEEEIERFSAMKIERATEIISHTQDAICWLCAVPPQGHA